MIETYKCNHCGYSAIDMRFYMPGKDVAICPMCNSDDIVVVK